MTASLVLVKHSQPDAVPGLPAREWRLGETGRARCAALASRLAEYRTSTVWSSTEPKALETAELVASALGLAVETNEDLHEHRRSTAGWLAQDDFERAIEELFRRPHERVFGEESADEAYERFAGAVDDVLARREPEDTVVVAHGTVISLFVARRAGVEPLPLWRRLGLPSIVTLARDGFAVRAVVDRVA